jgi:hypothetical protein
MLSAVRLNVVMLSVVAPFMLSVTIRSINLSVIMSSVVILNVVAPYQVPVP